MSLRARTSSVDETRALAAAIASIVQPGDLILLSGELGAGKTSFVQGFGEALGVTERITSPTFVLAQSYEGRIGLNHLDAYRFENLADVMHSGLWEVLDEEAVTLVEWGDVVAPTVPSEFLEVRITLGEGDDDRMIEVTNVGSSWFRRLPVLTRALAPWTGGDGPC